MNTETIKQDIRRSYGDIAKGIAVPGCCSDTAYCGTGESGVAMAEDYAKVDGYEKDANLSLGCGLPTEMADIREGNTVVDLGSGAGNDVFIARRIVGDTGTVIGIDMTPEMVIRALQNNQKLGYKNVYFELGDIENMQSIPGETADVVISNCVMNLIPAKEKAFKEIFRVLRTGGHFAISDIVHSGVLPPGVLEAAEMFAGCVSGSSEKGKYLGIIKSAGFKNIQIRKERRIELPDDLLLKYVTDAELQEFRRSGSGIDSVTIYADKLDSGNCCETSESGCCGSTAPDKTKKTACCGTSSGSNCCS